MMIEKGKVLKGLLCLVLTLSFFNVVNAQSQVEEKRDTSDIDSKTRLEVSANYMNNMIYAGRNFGMNGYSINQSVAFIHKSGLGLTLENYGFSKDAGFLSESDLTASYSKSLTSKLSLNLGFTHLFNYSDSAGLFNRLNNIINVSAGYNLGLFTLSNTLEYNFGNEDGWYDHIAVNREIALFEGEDQSMSINPTFSVEMGTKSVLLRLSHGKKAFKSVFYKKFSKVNRGKKLKSAQFAKNGNAGITTTTVVDETTTASNNSFGILSYDITLPITYTSKNFTFALTPYYSIPINLTPGETTISGNPFIVTASITYKLPV
ncbi:MAG: hypothetical protein Q8859_06390 [Bacteroidota bacterium]|nr:hypothetical protein [Bacteroidota bacterium]